MESHEAAWDDVAAGYDDHVTEPHFPLAERALTAVGLKRGISFLDVASGSGALAIPAARRGADVVAVDISPVMVERLQKRAAAEGLRIDARVGDGQNLDIGDQSFDCVGSEFGVMLFPDLARGLREMTRVTKPGGTVLMVAFGHPSQVEFLSFFVRSIQAVVPSFTGLPMDPPPLPFQVADPNRLKTAMESAGLQDVDVDQSAEEIAYPSGDALWKWLLGSNPIAGMVLGQLRLGEAQIATVKRRMDELVLERAGGHDMAVLTSPVNIGIGTRPSASPGRAPSRDSG